MNRISLNKGKIAFQLLLLVLFQWKMIICQLNLRNTDETNKYNSLEFDCLNYYIFRNESIYQDLPDVVNQIISYCFRLENKFNGSFEDFPNPVFQNLSFKDLCLMNITSEQLMSWSIPINIVERYEFYLNEPNDSLNEYFNNCTEPWFGPKCQYSFEFGDKMSFDEIIKNQIHNRIEYFDSSNLTVKVPCYVLLKCYRNGKSWCLDWREVCNGIIDCFDNGIDEEFCFDMEINECKENEYRCHNGLCISDNLWEDGEGDADCLDRSDTLKDASYTDLCYKDPTFRCEEHSCRPDVRLFPCGDGQCVTNFEKCANGRHILLTNSIIVQGNLGENCWIAMVCLTKLVEAINENLCEILRINNSLYEFLKECDSVFQFPTISVYSDHIRFFYENVSSRSSSNKLFLPDYICYDQELCDSIPEFIVYKNFTCLQGTTIIEELDESDNPWPEINMMLEQYFRRCLIRRITFHDIKQYSDHPSLYKCQNSMKMISTYRIMDGKWYCFEDDDEKYKYSCQLNQTYRVQCGSKNECWSPLKKYKVCIMVEQPAVEVPFQRICDNKIEIDLDKNEVVQNYEDNCPNWLCNNMYTRCDGYWSCPDGEDENNCTRLICPLKTFACVSPISYTVICSPASLVNNGSDDCLGASDEQDKCLTYPVSEVSRRFYCSDGELCIRSTELCNYKTDCESGDDEKFCKNLEYKFRCEKDSMFNRSNIEEILCGLSEAPNRQVRYFSLYTSSNYPLLEENIGNEIIPIPIKQEQENEIINVNITEIKNNSWPWYCNRGIVVRIWNNNNNTYKNGCMCPPSYYGNNCEYENERISLTIKLSSIDRYSIYSIIIMLIDNNDKEEIIETYNQFIYRVKESCSMKLNQYLLFSRRPKNKLKNYSIRIDIFEKTKMIYIGSYHYLINFLFLPVNRLSISLILSNYLIQQSFNCLINCKNGECIKYINKEKYFCRCYHGWSGKECNKEINCKLCSSDSICIGSSNNQSICVCPLNKFGSRCLLKSTCQNNICQNNGQCIPGDITIPGNNYTCICSNRYFDKNCQYTKYQLDISLNNIYIPKYVVAYFFTLSNKSEPIQTNMIQKLTLFQHRITFYISIAYHLVIIKANQEYYLAVLQKSPKKYISTLISSNEKCISVEEINSTLLEMIPYQRIIPYHNLCYSRIKLNCFFDDIYFCLCTNEYHANCMKFKTNDKFQCTINNYCLNKGNCLQDHPTCPATRICICDDCFFGNQCQFYAKGFGSTLDEILGYEFKHNTILSQQSFRVKVSAIVTISIFLIGIINGILSIMTFLRKNSQEVGCGIYLLASSIISILNVTLFLLKFCFLFLSHQNYFNQHIQEYILNGNCLFIEPLLRMSLYLYNWLHACVAIERTINTFQGLNFNRKKSKSIAKFIVILLVVINSCLFIPQLLNLHVFEDKTEERTWCVVTYSPWLEIYTSILLFIHYFIPLFINLISVLFIIWTTTHQRANVEKERSFWNIFRLKLKQLKYRLINPFIIICLTLPHLIISIILECNKSSHLFWFYLIGYFLSFIPTAFVFIIFVIPSVFYRKEFKAAMKYIRRRFHILKLNFTKL